MNTDNTNETPKNYGWICPKCGRVNSPYIDRCPCSGDTVPKLPPYKPVDPWIPNVVPVTPTVPYPATTITWIYDGPITKIFYGDQSWMD